VRGLKKTRLGQGVLKEVEWIGRKFPVYEDAEGVGSEKGGA